MDLEVTHHLHTGLTEDHLGAALAFVEKREPRFAVMWRVRRGCRWLMAQIPDLVTLGSVGSAFWQRSTAPDSQDSVDATEA
jgi:hypothetical protein